MKIRLSQQEIKQAVHAWLSTQGVSLVGKDVTIGFTATRGDEGIVAEVSIEDQAQIPAAQVGYVGATHGTLTVTGSGTQGVTLASDNTTTKEVATNTGTVEVADKAADPAEVVAGAGTSGGSLFGGTN